MSLYKSTNVKLIMQLDCIECGGLEILNTRCLASCNLNIFFFFPGSKIRRENKFYNRRNSLLIIQQEKYSLCSLDISSELKMLLQQHFPFDLKYFDAGKCRKEKVHHNATGATVQPVHECAPLVL